MDFIEKMSIESKVTMRGAKLTVREKQDILTYLQQDSIIDWQIKSSTLKQKDLQVFKIIADVNRRLSNESYR
jgi:hypothetical protein